MIEGAPTNWELFSFEKSMDSFSRLNKAPSRTLEINGKEYLFFGGTSYLGIGGCKKFQQHCIEGVRKYGFSNGTSRSNNVQLGIFERAESEMAVRFAAGGALLSSSGFLAGQLVVRYFANFGEIIYGPNSHPALWLDEKPISYSTFEDWILKTVTYINRSDRTRFLIISDSLNNFHPQLFDFTPFSKISETKEVILLVDDSHGIGVTYDGKGIYNALPSVPHIQKIVVASLAKGIGIDGGVVLAKQGIIDQLKASPMFSAASPPSPAFLYAFIKSEEIYQENRERLKSNMMFFAEHISDKLQYTKGFPVFYAENPELYEQLVKKGVVISSFNYPQASDPLMNRIVINSLHTEADLRYLLSCL